MWDKDYSPVITGLGNLLLRMQEVIQKGKRAENGKHFYVYMLASHRNGTIYKGMTSDLIKRIGEHKEGYGSTFTNKYKVKHLVWYLECETAENAIMWEKRLRKYPRQWKINLIEEMNPEWKDLSHELYE